MFFVKTIADVRQRLGGSPVSPQTCDNKKIVAAQSIHFPRERVTLIKFIWNLLAMLHVKELAESFSTQGSFLNNVVRKAAQEVSVTKSQLHSSQNQLQKSHKKVEQLLEETAAIKEQALRDKIKYEKQAQCTVEDLRGRLEKSNVSLAVSQGEIKRLRVKLSEEKTLLKSAMTTAELQSNRKDEMVQSLQSKCKKTLRHLCFEIACTRKHILA